MAAFLRAVGIPEVGDRLVERLKCLELYAVLVLIVLADVHQVVGKLFVVLRSEVVLAAIGIAADAAAVGHVIGARVAESLEDGIGPPFLDFQHYLALGGIALPVVLVAAEVLETFHLGTQALAVAHVVLGAMTVLRVVASADVIAEVTVVKTGGTDQPVYYLVYLLVCPLAALACTPAERHAPAVKVLTHQLWVNHVAEGIGRWRRIGLLGKVPQVLHIRPTLVRVHFLVAIVAVGAQILVVGLAAQLHVVSHALFYGPLGLVARSFVDER